MKIVALVENTSNSELTPIHGLSLYIETENHKILFDLGSDKTLFQNAEKRNIDLSAVDIVIISHGHADHGGTLPAFLAINNKAKVYIQRLAFEKHYLKLLFLKVYVGLNRHYKDHPQVVLLDGDYVIDDELQVFTVSDITKCYSKANKPLYDQNGRDHFAHEQNLLITETTKVLIMGCGHTGIVNILDKATQFQPSLCIGGYHVWNPQTKRTIPHKTLDAIAEEMAKHDIEYYTCHCTGIEAFQYLEKHLPKMHYLACGDTIDI